MVISHNLLAMNAQRQFNITGTNKKKSTEKLSSGYRINRAADDAAGLAISEKMRSQIRGLDQGARNTQDGISLLQVADGALEEVHDMLHRMSELAIQAANGTNTLDDRQAIQQEIDEIKCEIGRIGETTCFNENAIFKGDKTILPIEGEEYVSGDLSGIAYYEEDHGSYVEFRVLHSYDYTVEPRPIRRTIGENTYTIGYTLSDIEKFVKNNNFINIKKGDILYQISPYHRPVEYWSLVDHEWHSLSEFEELDNPEHMDLFALFDGGSNPIIRDSNGDGVDDEKPFNVTGKGFINVTTKAAIQAYTPENAFSTAIVEYKGSKLIKEGGSYPYFDFYVLFKPRIISGEKEIINDKKLWIQSGAEVNDGLFLTIPHMNEEVIGVKDVNVLSEALAGEAIEKISDAVEKISEARSMLGAQQNRLEHTYKNVTNISENTQAAESRIRDTDMAKEMVELSKHNILEQMGTSMIVQANQSNQGVVNLLQ